MKKRIIFVFAFVFLVGCGTEGISRSDYADVVEERDELLLELEHIQEEYDDYKEKMREYENLSLAEAQSREIEAQRIIDEEKARKEAERQAKIEQEEAEEKIGYDTGITYKQLARTPDDYVGKKVKFTGEVVQVVEGDGIVQIRFAVDSDYNSMLFCEYQKSIVSERVLENDVVTIYGKSYGLYTYESTFGSQITIPAVIIDKIEYSVESNTESDAEKEKNIVYDDENVTIYYTGISEDYSGYDINLLVENKSSRTLCLYCRETSVNSFMIDPSCSIEISPGKKANDGMSVFGDDSEQVDFNDIENIETKFYIYDSSDWSWGYETENIIVFQK